MFRIRSAGWLIALALAPLAAGCGQISQGNRIDDDHGIVTNYGSGEQLGFGRLIEGVPDQ